MSSPVAATVRKKKRPGFRRLTIAAAIAILFAAMALDTRTVGVGSSEDARNTVFSAEEYGKATFPKVQTEIEARAVDAMALATAIAADRKAAETQYGVGEGIGPVMSVKFNGVVGEGKSGIYKVAVDGLPDNLLLRVQTGPAINGTELRDATGSIAFGQFTNQIEYQDAGSALNNEMKRQVLSTIDTTALTGKTISVVGAFKLINPKSWLVTPVRLSVQ